MNIKAKKKLKIKKKSLVYEIKYIVCTISRYKSIKNDATHTHSHAKRYYNVFNESLH